MDDRLRVSAHKEKGKIFEFVVQYEGLFCHEWEAIVRYDTAVILSGQQGRLINNHCFLITTDNYNIAFT